MIPSLHPATASLPDPEAYVSLAARNGFKGVDHSAGYWNRWVNATSLAYVQEYCDSLDCRIVHGSVPVNFRDDDETFASDMGDLPAIAETMKDLGVLAMCRSIPPSVADRPEAAGKRLIARLQQIRDVLQDHGLMLGLEFVGPKTSRREGYPFVYDLAGILDLCAEVGEGCGLLLDSYHWYTSHCTLGDLMDVEPEQIVHVHINDAMDGPIDELDDYKRLLPGAGVIDLHGFLGAIGRLGYDGPVSVETFSDSLNAAGPEEAARLAGDTMRRVVGPFCGK